MMWQSGPRSKSRVLARMWQTRPGFKSRVLAGTWPTGQGFECRVLAKMWRTGSGQDRRVLARMWQIRPAVRLPTRQDFADPAWDSVLWRSPGCGGDGLGSEFLAPPGNGGGGVQRTRRVAPSACEPTTQTAKTFTAIQMRRSGPSSDQESASILFNLRPGTRSKCLMFPVTSSSP